MRRWPRWTRASGCFPPRWMRYVRTSRRWRHAAGWSEGITMRTRTWIAALAALLTALALAGTAQAQTSQKKVLKLGWAQDPQTLSPFVDYDEEDFRVWAWDYDLLVNFSPDDL